MSNVTKRYTENRKPVDVAYLNRVFGKHLKTSLRSTPTYNPQIGFWYTLVVDIFPPRWLTKETDHLVFYYLRHPKLGELELEEKINPLIKEREDAYVVISKYLGVGLQNKVNFYLFPSREIGLKLLGGLSPNQALPGIYTIFSRAKQTPGHELSHVLSYYMTDRYCCKPRMLSEGLATYLDQSGRNYHKITRKLIEGGEDISLGRLLNQGSDFYRGENQKISYPAAASFTAFLIESYGLGKFKEAWGCDESAVVGVLKSVYRKSFSDLEKSWLKVLKQS